MEPAQPQVFMGAVRDLRRTIAQSMRGMISTDIRPAVVFVVCVAAVYLMAAVAALRLLRHRKLRALAAIDRIALVLAGIGLVCIAYGFVEPYRIAISHVAIRSSKIPPGGRPIRIVHLSDLHSDDRPRLERRLLEVVAAEHPDVIVFTGDAINSLEALPVFRECMAALAKIAPTFAVRGNVDVGDFPGADLFGDTGVTELDRDAVRLDVNGQPVWIAGLRFDHWKALSETVDTIPPMELSVLLYHSPDLMPDVVAQRIDLFCAGHTHGGQVALPLYGALITFSTFGKRYESGLYREGSTSLYVNRGVGMSGGFAPRVRFWSRPEVTVIEISSGRV